MGRQTFRRIITSDEIIEKINPKNKRLVERFLKNLSTRRSAETIRVYQSNYNIFFCWNVLNNDNKFFVNIKKIEFMDFFDYASLELKWSPARYAQMWSTLNSLGTFIENILDDDYPDYRNQIKKIEKNPVVHVRDKTILSTEQVINLLNHLTETSIQEACFISLLASSGVRVQEAFRFTTDIIDESNTAYEDLFLETTEAIKTKGRGTTGKKIHKYILKDLFLPYYRKWLPEREKIMKKHSQEHNFIFIKEDGSPATVGTARSWNRRWTRYLTNEEPTNTEHKQIVFYPHCLRHFLCTYLAKNNIPQELIVELFGWTSADMFTIYNDLTTKDKEWKELKNLSVNKTGIL